MAAPLLGAAFGLAARGAGLAWSTATSVKAWIVGGLADSVFNEGAARKTIVGEVGQSLFEGQDPSQGASDVARAALQGVGVEGEAVDKVLPAETTPGPDTTAASQSSDDPVSNGEFSIWNLVQAILWEQDLGKAFSELKKIDLTKIKMEDVTSALPVALGLYAGKRLLWDEDKGSNSSGLAFGALALFAPSLINSAQSLLSGNIRTQIASAFGGETAPPVQRVALTDPVVTGEQVTQAHVGTRGTATIHTGGGEARPDGVGFYQAARPGMTPEPGPGEEGPRFPSDPVHARNAGHDRPPVAEGEHETLDADA